MNPVKRFGAKVPERNGDCLKTWQRHFEGKTQRQAGAEAPKVEQGLTSGCKKEPKVEQGLVEDVAKRHFEDKTQRQTGAEGSKVEQGLGERVNWLTLGTPTASLSTVRFLSMFGLSPTFGHPFLGFKETGERGALQPLR